MGKLLVIICSCITQHTVAISECILPSHHTTPFPQTQCTHPHIKTYICIMYHVAVEIGRATEQPRKHPSHLPNVQRSPNPCPCPSPLHQSADPTHHKHKNLSRGLSVYRLDRSMSMRPGLITGLRNINKANDPYAVSRNARGKEGRSKIKFRESRALSEENTERSSAS